MKKYSVLMAYPVYSESEKVETYLARVTVNDKSDEGVAVDIARSNASEESEFEPEDFQVLLVTSGWITDLKTE